jgi:methylglutaconyl-CoA hydratase
MSEMIISEQYKDIVLLTLSRPEKRNALNPELVDQLHSHLDKLKKDKSVRVIILTGAGKSFCAGADLAYMQRLSQYSDEENLKDSLNLAGLFEKIYRFPKITIAMINGSALAGGCGLALCCDYIFASEKAKLGFTEVRIGFIPAIVMNFLIRKIDINKAFKIVISGDIISAEKAKEIGMVHEIYTADNLKKKTMEFGEELLNQNSFFAMVQTKELYQQLLDLPLSKGLKLAGEVNAKSRKTKDCLRGLSAFLNKEQIVWRN